MDAFVAAAAVAVWLLLLIPAAFACFVSTSAGTDRGRFAPCHRPPSCKFTARTRAGAAREVRDVRQGPAPRLAPDGADLRPGRSGGNRGALPSCTAAAPDPRDQGDDDRGRRPADRDALATSATDAHTHAGAVRPDRGWSTPVWLHRQRPLTRSADTKPTGA